MRSKAISLGEQLVALLGENHDVDLLSRWMAHYVAEQMIVAESARGKAKATAEKRCFETILKLWAHRTSLPVGVRPFDNFDPIFRVLERLDPESPRGYYFGARSRESNPELDSVESWVEFMSGVDHVARILISFGLAQATEHAADESTKNFLRDAVPMAEDHDIEAVERLIEFTKKPNGADGAQKRINRLRGRLEQLDRFAEICAIVRKDIAAEVRADGPRKGSKNKL